MEKIKKIIIISLSLIGILSFTELNNTKAFSNDIQTNIINPNEIITSAYSPSKPYIPEQGGGRGIYREKTYFLSYTAMYVRQYEHYQEWINGRLYKGTLYYKTSTLAGYSNTPTAWVTYAGYIY